jgi:hypothetical protein
MHADVCEISYAEESHTPQRLYRRAYSTVEGYAAKQRGVEEMEKR